MPEIAQPCIPRREFSQLPTQAGYFLLFSLRFEVSVASPAARALAP